MRILLIITVFGLLFLAALPHGALAVQSYSNFTVSIFCYNTTLNLTTDKTSYQYTEIANMTVLLNNTQNFNDLNERLLLELYDSGGTLVAYMASDNATAPGNGTNTTSYYRNLSDISAGTYTLRARVVPSFTYPSLNQTAHDCSLNGFAVQAEKNITVTQEKPNPPSNLILILNKTVGSGYEEVTLNWTASNSSNVFNYIIYSTDNWLSGFNYSNPYGTTTGTNWTDVTSDGVDQRYYVVRTNGTSGVTDDNTYAVVKWNLKMYTGWNLLSLPILVWNETMNDVFYTATHNDKCERWIGGTQLFQRANFFGPRRVWSGEFLTIQPDVGYWYFSRKAGYDTTPYNNTLVGAVPINARNESIYGLGWTMLGWTSVNTTKLNSVLTNATHNDKIELYVAPTDVFQRTNFFGPRRVWSGEFSNLEPGRGYWYYSKNATIYTWAYRP